MLHDLSDQLLTLGERIHYLRAFRRQPKLRVIEFRAIFSNAHECLWNAFSRFATDANFFLAVFANSKKYSIKYTSVWRKQLVVVINMINISVEHYICLINKTRHGFSDEILESPFQAPFIHFQELCNHHYIMAPAKLKWRALIGQN